MEQVTSNTSGLSAELPAAPTGEQPTPYLTLQRESEERKQRLEQLQAEVQQLRALHTLAMSELEAERGKLLARALVAEGDARRDRQRLVIAARSLCPLVRAYRTHIGPMAKDDSDGTIEKHLRYCAEMLALLEPLEKM